MKLTIEHLAPYLPYKINIMMLSETESKEPNIEELKSIDTGLKMVNFGWGNAKELNEFKPILRPLSELDVDGEVYTPEYVSQCIYSYVQHLLKNHYDIFGLIEKGLAIDINTL